MTTVAATKAATALNRLIAGATTLPVVLGEASRSAKQSQEQQRPYVRLIYQAMGQPTPVPGRRRGLLSVYVYGTTPEEAWHHGNGLLDALGLISEVPIPGVQPWLNHVWLKLGWQRLPDPTEGGLVTASLAFEYHG